MVICIVPMKGNSERIPHKNIASMGGRPLCWYLLKTLTVCRIDRLIVDTDSTEIADVVHSFQLNIEVDLRPPKYCGDTVHGNLLVKRFVADPDVIYIQSHITSPFVYAASVDRAISAVNSGNFDNAFSVTEIRQRGWFKRNDELIPLNHDGALRPLRTQDIQPILVENGAFFVFRGHFFLKHGSRNGPGGLPLPLSFPETVDVDTPDDLWLAEQLIHATSNPENKGTDSKQAIRGGKT